MIFPVKVEASTMTGSAPVEKPALNRSALKVMSSDLIIVIGEGAKGGESRGKQGWVSDPTLLS